MIKNKYNYMIASMILFAQNTNTMISSTMMSEKTNTATNSNKNDSTEKNQLMMNHSLLYNNFIEENNLITEYKEITKNQNYSKELLIIVTKKFFNEIDINNYDIVKHLTQLTCEYGPSSNNDNTVHRNLIGMNYLLIANKVKFLPEINDKDFFNREEWKKKFNSIKMLEGRSNYDKPRDYLLALIHKKFLLEHNSNTTKYNQSIIDLYTKYYTCLEKYKILLKGIQLPVGKKRLQEIQMNEILSDDNDEIISSTYIEKKIESLRENGLSDFEAQEQAGLWWKSIKSGMINFIKSALPYSISDNEINVLWMQEAIKNKEYCINRFF